MPAHKSNDYKITTINYLKPFISINIYMSPYIN
jgi:hypothetical protein